MYEDIDYQAQSDARTLARANEIMSDKSRHSRAVAAAQRLLKETEEETKAMRKVAKGRGQFNPNSTERLNDLFQNVVAKV